jgi:hypothetical protein
MSSYISTPYLFDTMSIAGCYLPALINGDASGIDDNEFAELDRFLMELHHRIRQHHDADEEISYLDADEEISYDLVVTSEESFVGMCEVSGLYSDCHDVNVIAHVSRRS